MRIYLTGFMGAGKTAVGRRLAGLLGFPFVDLDEEVEAHAGASIREIFERSGEGAFRRMERERLEATGAAERLVVATGGGTLTFPSNLALVRRLGVSVWIHPSFATLVERIGAGKEDRPLFRDEEQALELYRRRLEAYRQADLRVDVSSAESPSEVAARIRLLLRERHCVT